MNFNYNFDTETFRLAWEEWKAYRKKVLKKPIKDEQRALNHIFNISGGVEHVAIMIMGRSMDNEYQGLFPLPANMKVSIPTNIVSNSKILTTLTAAEQAKIELRNELGFN